MTKKTQRVRISPLIPSLLCVLLLVAALAIGFVFIDSIERKTTDPSKYQRVLRQNDYPGNPLLAWFPAEIPDGAEDVQFYYLSTIVGKTFALRYTLEDTGIAAYERRYAQASCWSGPAGAAAAAAYGIYDTTIDVFDGAEAPPEDLTLYLLYFQTDETQNSLNHGQHCVVAISRAAHEILFFANKW